MDLEHPDITRARRTGYPYSHKRQDCFYDAFGSAIYPGDQYIDFHGETYLVDDLSADAIEILERHGGIYKTAE